MYKKEAKACPFCGVVGLNGPGNGRVTRGLSCQGCGAGGPRASVRGPRDTIDPTEGNRADKQAYVLWNRRAGPTRPMLEDLRRDMMGIVEDWRQAREDIDAEMARLGVG